MSEPTEPTFVVEDVTPEMAEAWLGRNIENRNVRQRQVEAYARDMESDAWAFTAEPIKFDRNGDMFDGQHRLQGVVKSGKTVRMLIARNLDPEVRDNVDTGISRQLADILKLRGETHANQLASITRAVFYWESGVRGMPGGNNLKATNSELLDCLRDHPELRDISRHALSVGQKTGLTASIAGLTMWLFDQVNPDDSAFFFDRLSSETGHTREDPIYELRRTLSENARRSGKGERDRTWVLGITIKAWNAYREGRQVSHYRLALGGASPEKFPEPV